MIWIKENGSEIETNDRKETIAYAESLGWKRKKAPVKKPVKKVVKDDNSGTAS